MRVIVSEYGYNKCVDFADKQLKTSADLYKYRGESNRDKIRDDIIVGKLAELGVQKFLKSSKPDFTIMKEERSLIVQI